MYTPYERNAVTSSAVHLVGKHCRLKHQRPDAKTVLVYVIRTYVPAQERTNLMGGLLQKPMILQVLDV